TKAELKAEAEALAKQQAEAEASQATVDAEKPVETTADAPESTEGEEKTGHDAKTKRCEQAQGKARRFSCHFQCGKVLCFYVMQK
ncbi:MAG: hypothetical protein ACK4OI_20315, partial [Rhizobium oryzihabitans]